MIETWSKGEADANMPQELLVDLYEKVNRHPWWAARARLARRLLDVHGVQPPASVVDVGCGWGTNLVALEQAAYQVTGLDISRRALEIIERPGRRLIEADLTQPLPPAGCSFDAALLLDVLEHLDDDRAALERVKLLLRPGGLLIVSVPALPELFSEFDEIQGHRRRYLPETLAQAFEGTGLRFIRHLWWGEWMVNVLRLMRRRHASGRQTAAKTYGDYLRLPPWPGTQLMRLAYQWEESRAVRGKLRCGTTLFALAIRE
jgi:SAM-dependent methyltransferase